MTTLNTRIYSIDDAHRLAMRVEVAMDVLKQLDLQRIVATSGVYVSFNGPTPAPVMIAAKHGEDLSEVLDFLPTCNVCAVGASLLSYARLFDSVPMGNDLGDDRAIFFYHSGDTENVKYIARRMLGDGFINDIEQVFEGWDATHRRVSYSFNKYGASGSETRMRVIMQDVIDHGGEFIMPRFERYEPSY